MLPDTGLRSAERSGTLMNRTQFPRHHRLVVLGRLRYKLNLRDLPEMFAVRGIVFSHEVVREWEAKLTLAWRSTAAAPARPGGPQLVRG